ncbi:polysaccharide export protein [Pseudoalteromonas lipolytica]|jgi:polysaccharide export outer membrane protein
MSLYCKLVTLILFFLFFTTGCKTTPGSNFEGVTSEVHINNLEEELTQINLQIIDSALIEQQKNDRHLNALPRSKEYFDTSEYEYYLGVGDMLAIKVWNHPELSTSNFMQKVQDFDGVRVQSDGTITYAYAPKIPARGKTIQQVHDELIERLARVIEEPQIDIRILSFDSQKVYVTGEVSNPGTFKITDLPLTLLDAINQAGGLTERANWQNITLMRDNRAEIINLDDLYSLGDVSQNRLLQDGDIVHVKRNEVQKVYVLGEVKDAGTVKMDRFGLSLAQAISEAGGLNEKTADANGVFVLRKRNLIQDGFIADVFQLNTKNIAALVLAEQFELYPSDIVYVTSVPLARWHRVISLLLPSLSTVEVIE